MPISISIYLCSLEMTRKGVASSAQLTILTNIVLSNFNSRFQIFFQRISLLAINKSLKILIPARRCTSFPFVQAPVRKLPLGFLPLILKVPIPIFQMDLAIYFFLREDSFLGFFFNFGAARTGVTALFFYLVYLSIEIFYWTKYGTASYGYTAEISSGSVYY